MNWGLGGSLGFEFSALEEREEIKRKDGSAVLPSLPLPSRGCSGRSPPLPYPPGEGGIILMVFTRTQERKINVRIRGERPILFYQKCKR